MTWEDPIVAEVRRTRENLSAKFDFDVSAIFADLRARQATPGTRLVKVTRNHMAEQTHAPEPAAGTGSDGQSSPPAR
jgi:hypothetical protein